MRKQVIFMKTKVNTLESFHKGELLIIITVQLDVGKMSNIRLGRSLNSERVGMLCWCLQVPTPLQRTDNGNQRQCMVSLVPGSSHGSPALHLRSTEWICICMF